MGILATANLVDFAKQVRAQVKEGLRINVGTE